MIGFKGGNFRLHCFLWRTVKKGKAATKATHAAADPLVAWTNKLYEKSPFDCAIPKILNLCSTYLFELILTHSNRDLDGRRMEMMCGQF